MTDFEADLEIAKMLGELQSNELEQFADVLLTRTALYQAEEIVNEGRGHMNLHRLDNVELVELIEAARDERAKRIIADYERLGNLRAVAESHGLTHEAVRHILRTHGVDTSRRRRGGEDR
jgi:hypothetical protein